MLRKCEPLHETDTNPTCGKTYDDKFRWTICPHRPLSEAPVKEFDEVPTEALKQELGRREEQGEGLL